jgi:hypothetical protein
MNKKAEFDLIPFTFLLIPICFIIMIGAMVYEVHNNQHNAESFCHGNIVYQEYRNNVLYCDGKPFVCADNICNYVTLNVNNTGGIAHE